MENSYICIHMRITFFGTGTSQGVPVIGCHCPVCQSSDPRDRRLRTSALIEADGQKILIDAGPDFRYQMLRSGTEHLDAILLTHHHKDHTGGLDDVRALNFLERRFVPIYCEQYVQRSLKMEYSYAFDSRKIYPGSPRFQLETIGPDEPFLVNGVEITPVRAYHAKLPVLGFRIGTIGYITDANRIPDEEFEKLKGLDVFVINCVTFRPHPSHFGLNQALEVIERVGAKKSFITHISHALPAYEEFAATLPEGVFPAHDMLSVEV